MFHAYPFLPAKRGPGRKKLAGAIAHRLELERIGTPLYLPNDYVKATDLLQDLARIIETGDTAKAVKRQPKVLAEMTATEIATLKIIHIVPAESMLRIARDSGGQKYAPVTFMAAEKSIANAHKVIELKTRDAAWVQLAAGSKVK